MKRVNVILAIILLMTGCGGNHKSGNESESFITVDVSTRYPQKEIILQDIMDVEYISLETNDEFLCQGVVQDIGDEMILVINNIPDGDIFIFDRNGNGVRKINRKGQGGEEYIDISSVILDEENGEIFVNDYGFGHKIHVYDLFGKFKRSFKYREGISYDKVYNYDTDNLICHHTESSSSSSQTISIISKRDGSTTKEIIIPIDQVKKATTIKLPQFMVGLWHFYHSMRFYQNDWILTEHSADTLYRYLPDGSMSPFIVRVPSITSMSPEVFLFPCVLTERYYFMQNFKKGNDEGYTTTELVYDKQEKTIFESVVYNGDYSNKSLISMSRYLMQAAIVNNDVAFWHKLEAFELVEAYEKGLLKGKLKEVASSLKEEDNPVIMIVKPDLLSEKLQQKIPIR